MLFESQGIEFNPLVEQTRVQFSQRFFDLAQSEYLAAVPLVTMIIKEILKKHKGDIYVLDVGCGQGHMMKFLLKALPKKITQRIVIDYLDPQNENLKRYQENLKMYRLDKAFAYRFEDFYGSPDSQRKYHFILAFQSLYSYNLTKFHTQLYGFRTLLVPEGQSTIIHSIGNASYFKLLKAMGHLFHTTVPSLNTFEDIEETLSHEKISFTKKVIPFVQKIPAARQDDLAVYVAANLYLMSEGPIMDRFTEIAPHLDEYRNQNHTEFQFNQDLGVITIHP